MQDRRRRQPAADCRIVGVVNSVQKFWTGRSTVTAPRTRSCSPIRSRRVVVARRRPSGRSIARPTSRSTSTSGSSRELHDRFGARGGPFAEAYVIAHEYGHHVQDLVGTTASSGRKRPGPNPVRYASSSKPIATPACGLRTRWRPRSSSRSRRPISPTGSTRPPRWETTAYKRRRRAGSTGNHGRTASAQQARALNSFRSM